MHEQHGQATAKPPSLRPTTPPPHGPKQPTEVHSINGRKLLSRLLFHAVYGGGRSGVITKEGVGKAAKETSLKRGPEVPAAPAAPMARFATCLRRPCRAPLECGGQQNGCATLWMLSRDRSLSFAESDGVNRSMCTIPPPGYHFCEQVSQMATASCFLGVFGL